MERTSQILYMCLVHFLGRFSYCYFRDANKYCLYSHQDVYESIQKLTKIANFEQNWCISVIKCVNKFSCDPFLMASDGKKLTQFSIFCKKLK